MKHLDYLTVTKLEISICLISIFLVFKTIGADLIFLAFAAISVIIFYEIKERRIIAMSIMFSMLLYLCPCYFLSYVEFCLVQVP